jgi:hypothetical protein
MSITRKQKQQGNKETTKSAWAGPLSPFKQVAHSPSLFQKKKRKRNHKKNSKKTILSFASHDGAPALLELVMSPSRDPRDIFH